MLDREKDGIYTTTVRGIVIGALTREQVVAAVDCRTCSAPRGSICTGRKLEPGKVHPERRREALKLYGLRPPEQVLSGHYIDNWYRQFRAWIKDPDKAAAKAPHPRRKQRTRSALLKNVTVRYVCPVCGQNHPKAEHPAKPSLRALVERRRKQQVQR